MGDDNDSVLSLTSDSSDSDLLYGREFDISGYFSCDPLVDTNDSSWHLVLDLVAKIFGHSSRPKLSIPDFRFNSLAEVLSAAKLLFGNHTRQQAEAAGRMSIESGEGIDFEFLSECDHLMSTNGFIRTVSFFQNRVRSRTLQSDIIERDYLSFPEFDRLLSIASHADIIFPDKFVPNKLLGGNPRPLYQEVQSALTVLTSRLVRKSQAIIVSAGALNKGLRLDGLLGHSSPYHWTPKPTNVLGRQICDYSGSDSISAVNDDPSLRSKLKEKYGELRHPSLRDYIRLYYNVKSRFPDENILIFKIDVTDAFPRIIINPVHIAWLLISMLSSLYLINLVGTFGYAGLPYIYGVVTRALEWKFASTCVALFGITMALIYVDDMVGFLPQSKASALISVAVQQAHDLLGIDAIRTEKNRLSHSEDVIGWRLDTKAEVCLPSCRAILKLCYLFFILTPKVPSCLTKRELQRLQSFVSRYSQALPFLRSFSYSFGPATRGLRSQNARRSVGTRIQTDIWFWRVGLVILCSQPYSIGIPFNWLLININDDEANAKNADIIVYSDAASSSQTVGVYAPSVGYFAFSFDSRKSHTLLHSNRLEFYGVVLGVYSVLSLLPYDSQPLHIHAWSDNTTAVADAEKRRARDNLSLHLLIILSLLQILRHCKITYGHIPGKVNVVADALSRNFVGLSEEASIQSKQVLAHLPRLSPPTWLVNFIQRESNTGDEMLSRSLLEILTHMADAGVGQSSSTA